MDRTLFSSIVGKKLTIRKPDTGNPNESRDGMRGLVYLCGAYGKVVAKVAKGEMYDGNGNYFEFDVEGSAS